ncbi:MAG: hypothetical protein QOG43_131 [Actinomycetota bacterium]|jgi:hypothetical protein|nr:hypothetical protein [Actinomycetota bacterium]
MTTTTFVGAKGGVGTSTVAAFHAIELAERTGSVHLTATAAAGIEDLAAVLGVPAPTPGGSVSVVPGLTLGDIAVTADHTVVDAGTDLFSDHSGAVLVVVRNDYLSLRRALNSPQTTVGIILVNETHRSLSRTDIEDVLPHPILAEVRVDPSIARSVDAGLVATSRRHRLAIDLPPDLDYAPIYLRLDADAG